MSLIVSLAIGYVFNTVTQFASPYGEEACTALACLSHWCILSSTFWMGLEAFRIAQIVTNVAQAKREQEKASKKFRWCSSAFGWGMCV